MFEALRQITLVEWVIFAWAVAQLLVKAGEWKRTVEARRTGASVTRPPESVRDCVTKDQLALELEKHSRMCRHDARELINHSVGEIASDVTTAGVEVRKHRDWLIEIQTELGLKRKDRS